jgi:hypothetical protein
MTRRPSFRRVFVAPREPRRRLVAPDAEKPSSSLAAVAPELDGSTFLFSFFLDRGHLWRSDRLVKKPAFFFRKKPQFIVQQGLASVSPFRPKLFLALGSLIYFRPVSVFFLLFHAIFSFCEL